MTSPIVAGALAAAAALLCTPLAMALARRVGAVDRPGPLKPQAQAVPHLGGPAVFVAVVPWVAWARPALVAPLAAALVLGMVDDMRGLPPWQRLAAQVAIGVGIAACLPTRFGEPGGGILVVVVTVLVVNGTNMIDGLDTLASGVVGASALGFAALLGGAGRPVAAATVGAVAGFVVYNRPPARVYLGDGGSCFLGALLAALLVRSWPGGGRASTGVAALVLVAVPVAEVAVAMVRRLRAGEAVVGGDRRHPYDLLVDLGWGRTQSALVYAGAQLALAAVAIGVARAHSLPGAVATAAAAGAALLVAAGGTGALRSGAGART